MDPTLQTSTNLNDCHIRIVRKSYNGCKSAVIDVEGFKISDNTHGLGGIAHFLLLAADYFTANCEMDAFLTHKTISIRLASGEWLKYSFYRTEGQLTHLMNYLDNYDIVIPPEGFVLNLSFTSDVTCIAP